MAAAWSHDPVNWPFRRGPPDIFSRSLADGGLDPALQKLAQDLKDDVTATRLHPSISRGEGVALIGRHPAAISRSKRLSGTEGIRLRLEGGGGRGGALCHAAVINDPQAAVIGTLAAASPLEVGGFARSGGRL